jgi:hypothetical protein
VELLAILEPHSPARHVEPRRAATEQQLDLVLGVPGRRAEARIAVAGRERLLRQGRAVVRRDRLRAHDPHRAVVTTGAQRLGRALGGEPAADDEDVLMHAEDGRHRTGKRQQRTVEALGKPPYG